MDISSLLNGPLGNQIISGLTSQLGVENKQVQAAITTAVPFLLTALNKNANSGDANNIANALDRDHDGSILGNLGSFFSSGDTSDGMGILKHVLGNSQSSVVNAISGTSGLNSNQSSQLLAMVAPVVMGFLGKEKKEQNLSDSNGLTSLIGNLMSASTQGDAKNQSMIEKLLDQDGDGSIIDDVMNLGSKFLGGFFKK